MDYEMDSMLFTTLNNSTNTSIPWYSLEIIMSVVKFVGNLSISSLEIEHFTSGTTTCSVSSVVGIGSSQSIP